MPEAEWESEHRVQSHLRKAAGILKASEHEEESFSTILFYVECMFLINLPFNSNQQP